MTITKEAAMEAALAEIAEPYFRRPEVVKQDDEYDDNPAALFAFTAHGFDTDLTPYYSAEQLKEAMTLAWTASRQQAMEEAAKLCEQVHATTGECPELALYCAEGIREAGKE